MCFVFILRGLKLEDVLELAKQHYRDVGAIVICAAIEAELQCVALERNGPVDAV